MLLAIYTVIELNYSYTKNNNVKNRILFKRVLFRNISILIHVIILVKCLIFNHFNADNFNYGYLIILALIYEKID